MKTDAQLIKEARTNADAFAELYERHVRSVHAWFRTRVEPASAMDLTAETFAQAAGGLRRFRDESDGSAGPWLFGIAKNLHRRFLERRRVETVGRRRLGMPLVTYAGDFDETDERVSRPRRGPRSCTRPSTGFQRASERHSSCALSATSRIGKSPPLWARASWRLAYA